MYRSILRIAAPVVLFLAAILISLPGIRGDLFFDSIPNIAANKAIQISDLSPHSLLTAALSFEQGPIGRPVPMLTFAVDWYLAGPDPAWFKLVNLLIHGINTVLVFFLVLRLLRLPAGRGTAQSGTLPPEQVAFLTTLLWAIAPIHGFTVLYVVQRMVLLSASFSLLALHAYLSLREAAGVQAGARVLVYTILFGLAGLLSLLSKETALLIPCYIAVIEVFLLRFRGLGRYRRILIGVIVLTAVMPIVMLGYAVWSSPAGIHAGYDLRNFGPEERMLTQARVLVMYLRNILIPDYGQLHFFYDNLPVSHSLFEPLTTALSIALLSTSAIVGIVLRRRLPVLGFAVYWFLVGHALEASFWPLELVFWHRNYLPSLGPLLAMGYGLVWLMHHTGRWRIAGLGLTGLALAVFAVQSRLIADDWSDRITLARAEVIKNPDSPRAGHYYARMALITFETTHAPALLTDAHRYFARAAAQDPNALHPAFALLYLAIVHRDGSVAETLAGLKQRAGQRKLEIGDEPSFQSVLELHRKYPDQFDLFDALEVLEAAIGNPRLIAEQRSFALYVKANLLALEGLPPGVYLPALREAVCISPRSPKYRGLLFRTLVDTGELDEAFAMLKNSFSRIDHIRDPLIKVSEDVLKERRSDPVKKVDPHPAASTQ